MKIALPRDAGGDFNDVLTGPVAAEINEACHVAAKRGAAQVRASIEAAPEMTVRDTWPKPDMRLIHDDRLPAPKLDDDVLPPAGQTGSPARPPRVHVRATMLLPG